MSKNSALAATAAADVVSATEIARLASKGVAALAARAPCLLGAGWLNSLLSTSPAEIQAYHDKGCGQELGGMESVLGGYLVFDGPASGVGRRPAYGHIDVEGPGAYSQGGADEFA
jgi:hypothetical protein